MKRQILSSLLIAVLAVGIAMMPADARAQDKLVLDGSTTVGPIAKAFAEAFMRAHPGVNITVSESGSGNGAKSLINSACDIADMSRFLKESEFQAAVQNGVMPVAYVVALDGLPVLVHPSNPVRGLSARQIHDIYAGKITNWSQVGGPNRPIVIISRETNSGTYETFEGLIMGGDKMASTVEYVGSNGAVRQRVQSTPNAIGYAGLGFVDRTVKALEVDRILPSRQTVVSGIYPISRPLFMITNGVPKMGTTLWQFINFYLTEDGQRIVEGIGFIPVTVYR